MGSEGVCAMFDIASLVSTLEFIAAATATLLVPVVAILFVIGRSEAASKALLWAVILAFLSVSGYAITAWLIGGEGGVGPQNVYIVTKPPSYASKYFPVEISVIPLFPTRIPYKVVVDWGDGVSETQGIAPQPLTVSRVYRSVGNYTVTVRVYEGWEGWGLKSEEKYAIRVSAPWREVGNEIKELGGKLEEEAWKHGFWAPLFIAAGKLTGVFGDIFERVSDFICGFMAERGIYAGFAFYYYVTMPGTSNFPALSSVYDVVRQWALYILVLALVINILWRAYWEFERPFALLDVFREFVWAVFVVFVGLYIYDACVDLVNMVSLSIAQLGQLSSIYSMALAFLASTTALGVFTPLAANLAALTALALIFLVLGGMLKWLLAAALVVVIPLMAALWLIPPLRGVVSAISSLLAGLFVFTLVAAALSRLTGELSSSLSLAPGGVENIVFAIVMPVIYLAVGPLILQMIGGHIGGFFLPSIRHLLRYGLGLAPVMLPSRTTGAPSMPPTGPGTPPAGTIVATGVGVLAPVVGSTTLRNLIAYQLMQRRMLPSIIATPAKPMIREVKHPKLETAKEVTLAIGKRVAAHYINNLRRAGETFKQTIYRETGIWLPGRTPRKEEIERVAHGVKRIYEIGKTSIKWMALRVRSDLRDAHLESRGSWK